ncbi:hypothetical protein [Thiosulfatihalobacter marinus]|uniref:hypothetical protein n=1 Tax=Thiosulfatihalobacter marinus TaxID=2792481 RepID=UPI001E6063E8|nr:hypothetical protein [Thiosulfatihalobacter marinus]
MFWSLPRNICDKLRDMDRYFSTEMPGLLFARNTLIASVLGLVPLLILYIALSPGFAAHLAGGGPALTRFLRQVLTNGLPVVFAVNYVGFFVFAAIMDKPTAARSYRMLIAVDLPLRVAVFVLLHAVIYVLSADWFGSFGGSRATALRVVAPTLARSALFGNISGVYLYATLLAALPVYATVFNTIWPRAAAHRDRGHNLRPWLAAALTCAAFALAITIVARLFL